MNLVIDCLGVIIVALIIFVLFMKEVGLMPLGITLGIPFLILIGLLIWYVATGNDD